MTEDSKVFILKISWKLQKVDSNLQFSKPCILVLAVYNYFDFSHDYSKFETVSTTADYKCINLGSLQIIAVDQALKNREFKLMKTDF